MKYILIIAMILSLSSCSFMCEPEIIYKTTVKKVYIPITKQCPQPKYMKKPTMTVNSLTKQSTNSEVAKAYVGDMKKLTSFGDELMQMLDAYRVK